MITKQRPDGLTIKRGQYKVKWWFKSGRLTTHARFNPYPADDRVLPKWIVMA